MNFSAIGVLTIILSQRFYNRLFNMLYVFVKALLNLLSNLAVISLDVKKTSDEI